MGAKALRSHSEDGAKKLTFDQHNRIFFRLSGIRNREAGIGEQETGNRRQETGDRRQGSGKHQTPDTRHQTPDAEQRPAFLPIHRNMIP